MTVMVLSQLDAARGGPQASGLASYANPSSLNGFAIRRITLLATSPPTSFQLSSERGRRFLLTSTLPSGGKASLFLLGLRRDPLCHHSAGVLPPRSRSLLPAVSEPGHWRQRCRERCSYTTDFGHDQAVLALRLPDGYDETLSAEVRGPSVPCQGFIRMTFSLNGLIRRCACAVITASGLTHARLALCFSLSKGASG